MRRIASGLAVAGALALAGCAPVLIGAGAVGGYAISRDAIRSHFDVSERVLYDLSRDVVEDFGFITEEDERRGRLRGEVEGATVTVTVERVSDRTVQLTIRARKYLMPRIHVAHRVYDAIRDRLGN